MRGLKTEFAVGTFALIVFAVLTFMTFRVGDFTWLKKQGYTVNVYFKNTAGLAEKTKVKIAGVDAGSIEKIELADGTARLALRMYPTVKLYSDAEASIKATGLLGDKYLEVNPGSRKPLLKQGDTIKNVIEITDVDDLIRNLSDFSLNFSKLAADLMEIVVDTEIKDALKETLVNLRDTSRNLKDAVSENNEKLRKILDRIDSLAASLNELIKDNRAPLTNTVANLDEFSDSLRTRGQDIIANLNKSSAELKALMEKSRPHIESITNSVSSLAKKMDRGEGTLGKLLTDEKLYSSITNTVEGVGKTISAIERFRTYITFKGDYLPALNDGKGHLYLTFQPRKDKYYILGIVDDPIGSVDVVEVTTSGTGTVKTDTVEAGIELTAQFARRFDNTVLRGGITESTFGIGADRFMFNDKLKLTFDAWDFRRTEHKAVNPHVRLGADYFLFKKLFLSGGIDNVFNSHRLGAYLGSGIRFEDEDLKYLFNSLPSIR